MKMYRNYATVVICFSVLLFGVISLSDITLSNRSELIEQQKQRELTLAKKNEYTKSIVKELNEKKEELKKLRKENQELKEKIRLIPPPLPPTPTPSDKKKIPKDKKVNGEGKRISRIKSVDTDTPNDKDIDTVVPVLSKEALMERSMNVYLEDEETYPDIDFSDPLRKIDSGEFLNDPERIGIDYYKSNEVNGILEPIEVEKIEEFGRLFELCGNSRSTMLFMNVYKSTSHILRKVFQQLARTCSLKWAQYDAIMSDAMCECKWNHCNINPEAKKELRSNQIVTGHFSYGLHTLYSRAFYGIMLRDPYECFIEGAVQQLRNSDKYYQFNIEDALRIIEYTLKVRTSTPGNTYRDDLFVRLIGNVITAETADLQVENAMNTLDRFEIVGSYEYWNMSMKIFQVVTDPTKTAGATWDTQPVSLEFAQLPIKNVINAIPYKLKQRINEYLKYEKIVWNYGKKLLYKQCNTYLSTELDCSQIDWDDY